jgi:hypothetical protein
MTAAHVPPPDLKFTCALCGEVVEGVQAVDDHLRLIHPEEYGDGPTRWPDGGIVYDVSGLDPGETLGAE